MISQHNLGKTSGGFDRHIEPKAAMAAHASAVVLDDAIGDRLLHHLRQSAHAIRLIPRAIIANQAKRALYLRTVTQLLAVHLA